jgi:hypothetical protein
VHRKYIQHDATSHSLFVPENCSTCFGWYVRPSSGTHTTVSTVSGICHTVTAICRYRGRFGTGLSVLWVAYGIKTIKNCISLLFILLNCTEMDGTKNIKFYIQWLPYKNRAVFLDNVEKFCRIGEATDDSITRRLRLACWITKATNTHSEHVIVIAFPLQQW